MLEIYSGVSFRIPLKGYSNDEIKQLKKDLENILKEKIYCNISQSNYGINLKNYEEDDFVVSFNTPNGSYNFPKEILNECKKIFKNEVEIDISVGFNGIKSVENWINPFNKDETLRLVNIGFLEKNLYLESTQEFIKKHTIENLEKGYIICDSFESSENNLIYGTKIVGRLKCNKKFKNNIEARMAAEKDGIKFINDIPHLPKNIYIDTLENREIIEKEIKNNSKYWTIEQLLYDLDNEQKELPKEKTYRYLYEKVYGKVDHLVWLYLDKNKYTEKEQKFFETIFKDYQNLYERLFINNMDIFINNLDKTKIEYDLILALLKG